MATCASNAYQVPNASSPDSWVQRLDASYKAEFGVAVVVNFLSISTFLLVRRYVRYPRLLVRRPIISVVYLFTNFTFIIGFVLPYVVGLDKYPCGLAWFLAMFTGPAMTSGAFIRNSTFLFLTRLARAQFTLGRLITDSDSVGRNRRDLPVPNASKVSATAAGDDAESRGAGPGDAVSESVRTSKHSELAASALQPVRAIWYCLTTIAYPDLGVDEENAIETLQMLRYLTSNQGIVSVYVTISLPYVIINLAYTLATPGASCTGCSPTSNPVAVAILIAEGIVNGILNVYMGCKFARLPDPWSIFVEARLTTLSLSLALVGLILATYTPVPASGPVDYTLFIVVGSCLAAMVGTVLQVWRAWATTDVRMVEAARVAAERRKKRLEHPQATKPSTGGSGFGQFSSNRAGSSHDLVAAGNAALPASDGGGLLTVSTLAPNSPTPSATSKGSPRQDGRHGHAVNRWSQPQNATDGKPEDFMRVATVLANPAMLESFQRHLEMEWGTESLAFILDTEAWLKAFSDLTPKARLARARKIVNLYVRTDAVFACNLPSAVQDAILAAIRSAEPAPDQLSANVFDTARAEMAYLLESGALPRWAARTEREGQQKGMRT